MTLLQTLSIHTCRSRLLLQGIFLALILTSCSPYRSFRISKKGPWHAGSERPYVDRRTLYRPQMHYRYNAVGYASWYGYEAHGNLTASGMRFDCRRLSAAHKTLPLPCVVRITNLENGRSIKVLVNDRGPFFKPKSRIIDVSLGVAKILKGYDKGVFRVQVKCLPEESRIAALLRRRKPYPYYPGHKTSGGYGQLPHKIPYIPLLNEKGSRAIVYSSVRQPSPTASNAHTKGCNSARAPQVPRRKTGIDKLLEGM
ncbi:MAG: septal ring lytic transglycosylase RlpA family protein [Holosporales bacterium]|nr:septal ring lytic transglycosylase RlpA family protein [Holosporales bacterium]